MNHELKIMRNKKGFTLVETMVVSVLLFTVGIMVVQLFFSSLKGGVKSNFLAVVKENGDYAKTVMERMIRSAKAVQSCSPSSIQIANPPDGITTTIFECSGTRIASISGFPSGNVTYYLTSPTVKVYPDTDCNTLFTCQTDGGATVTKIGIRFTLSENVDNPKPEETAQQTFETTVTLRNY